MQIPKFIRKWVYKRILNKIQSKSWRGKYYAEETYLCLFCEYTFPYINIRHYPELWDRKETTTLFRKDKNTMSIIWFNDEEERKNYVQQALDLINNKP